MKLFLVRHGETVDNVKGVYAGSLDSQLTNHGVEQTRLLGAYLAQNDVKFTNVFASPLSRAFRTADAIRKAQPKELSLEIVKVQELIERDYGPYEGKSFSSRSNWMKTGKDGHDDDDGVESIQALAKRGDEFLDEHLLPLFEKDSQSEELVVAVVAHGMLLSHLWRRLLLRLPRKSLTIAPEITATRSNLILEHIGGWSNTGYLELSIRREQKPEAHGHQSSQATDATTLPTPVPPPVQAQDAEVSIAPPESDELDVPSKSSSRVLYGYSTTILAIDSKQHLVGIRRQPGGIGSSAHDEGQKKLDGFFKRQKLS